MSATTDNDTSVLEHFEAQFQEENSKECSERGCDEKAIWKHVRYSCCSAVRYACGLHKYGRYDNGQPAFPGTGPPGMDPNAFFHTNCGTDVRWIDALVCDEWVHL